MARCPFAKWLPISGSCGPYVSGPYRIVHHTTEGSTAEGAMEAFRSGRSDPHFTVSATDIFQHIDTAEGARALEHPPGIETNRDSAVQIELVGFAHLPKNPQALANVARLCRWIEAEHGVPRVWPDGPPKPAVNGQDPGGHNRNPQIWVSQGGHYGHCNVPGNTHWDPGYTAQESAFVLSAEFDAQGHLIEQPHQALLKPMRQARAPKGGGKAKSTMPDHNIVAVGLEAYVRDLILPPAPIALMRGGLAPGKKPRAAKTTIARGRTAAPPLAAKVDVGSLLSFVDGVGEQQKEDVLYSVQLAQRAASGACDRFTQTRAWYQKYVEVLENLGWTTEQFAFTSFDQSEGEFRMDQAALKIITAIATQNQLAVLQQSIAALSSLTEEDGAIRMFDFHASTGDSGNFQLGSVQSSDNGALSMALGAFYFRSTDERKRFLFFKWGARQVNFWTAAQRMTLNTDFYARRRKDVIAKLESDASQFIVDLKLG